MDIRKIVTCRLKELDRSQTWLAEKIGVSRQAVSQFLSGRRGMDMVRFVKLLRVLGLEVRKRK
jgi:predicted transcriptional regulator